MTDRGPVQIEEQEVREVRLWIYQREMKREIVAQGADGFTASRWILEHELMEMRFRSDMDVLIARRSQEAQFDAAHRCVTLDPGAYRVLSQEFAHV